MFSLQVEQYAMPELVILQKSSDIRHGMRMYVCPLIFGHFGLNFATVWSLLHVFHLVSLLRSPTRLTYLSFARPRNIVRDGAKSILVVLLFFGVLVLN